METTSVFVTDFPRIIIVTDWCERMLENERAAKLGGLRDRGIFLHGNLEGLEVVSQYRTA